jgi:hypothetical protein
MRSNKRARHFGFIRAPSARKYHLTVSPSLVNFLVKPVSLRETEADQFGSFCPVRFVQAA